MAFSDRDYYRRPSRQNNFGAMSAWNITTWLIAINVAVFLLDHLTQGRYGGEGILTQLGHFSFQTAIQSFQLWRFITFQFLHADGWHIFYNMLALYFFGPMVERYLGPRRYLAFYLLCGIAGAATFVLLMLLHLLQDGATTQLIGASAGIFGVLIAAATRVAPDATVMLYFAIPVKLRVLAWLMVGIAAYTVFFNGHNAGGQAAHLGGAALGYFLIERPQVLNIFVGRPRRR